MTEWQLKLEFSNLQPCKFGFCVYFTHVESFSGVNVKVKLRNLARVSLKRVNLFIHSESVVNYC